MKPVQIANPSAASPAKFERLIEMLTVRERQVFRGLLDGMSNKGIAHALNLSPRTVENHRTRLMTKIEAKSMADAVRIGLNAGLAEGPAAQHFSDVA